MFKIIFIIILTAFVVNAQDLKERTGEVIRSHFDSPVKLEMIKYHLPAGVKKKVESAARQKFFGDDVYLYKIYKDQELIAAAVLDNVYGKAMPITFLVLMDTSGKILSAEVMKYREQYGGAVQNKNWTDQFKGKNSESGYQVGEDINTISGATISVNSVTSGIKKAVLLYKEIRGEI